MCQSKKSSLSSRHLSLNSLLMCNNRLMNSRAKISWWTIFLKPPSLISKPKERRVVAWIHMSNNRPMIRLFGSRLQNRVSWVTIRHNHSRIWPKPQSHKRRLKTKLRKPNSPNQFKSKKLLKRWNQRLLSLKSKRLRVRILNQSPKSR